jgi:prepilin-type N-terminal cleavage/methylation domain-containing protein
MDKIYWKSKKGTTLVEVLAAVIILAIVAVAVLTSIGFSQTTIFSGSSEGDAAAQAQSIADALIPELNSKDPSAVKAETVGDAVYVEPGSFPNATKDKQFTSVISSRIR